MSETLTQFGTSFQSKIIASLLGDVKFIQTINDILDSTMFDSDSNKWLVKTIKDYFYEYKKQPTLEVIKYKFQTMFLEDKLYTALPNVNSWLFTNFNQLNHYAKKTHE